MMVGRGLAPAVVGKYANEIEGHSERSEESLSVNP